MRIFRVPPIVFKLFPQIFWKDTTAAEKVYLTFDDGPDPNFTPKILDILKKEDVFASFFVIGQKAQQYPELIHEICQIGHTIGIHSFEHERLFLKSRHFIHEQLSKSKFFIERIIPKSIKYFRPPYGIFSPRLVKICHHLDLTLIMWSMMSYDFDKTVTNHFVLKLIESKASSGDIIVFHDGHANSNRTIKTLASVIKILKDRGFQLNSIAK